MKHQQNMKWVDHLYDISSMREEDRIVLIKFWNKYFTHVLSFPDSYAHNTTSPNVATTAVTAVTTTCTDASTTTCSDVNVDVGLNASKRIQYSNTVIDLLHRSTNKTNH